jgi:hypothetical protein
MANESLVHSVNVAGPDATHVIAIGVGAYDHLTGANPGPVSPHAEGMGQLTSAPTSVTSFVDWIVTKFSNPKELASVRLLAAGVPGDKYTNPKTGQEHAVERATIDNVKKAVREWKAAGDSSLGNLMVFYFVGHGIASGTLQSLLLADFGADDNAPLEGAVDFMSMRVGMSRCKARQQLYFIDACRAFPRKLLTAGLAGDPIIVAGLGTAIPEAIEAPVFYSTLLGQEAYGRPGKSSVFTEALLCSFRGAASDNSAGEWRVHTSGLLDALTFYMRRADENYELVQKPTTSDTSVIYLHQLNADPVLPVLLRCDPPEANAHVEFVYSLNGGAPMKHKGGPMDVEIPFGSYMFDWTFPNLPPGLPYQKVTQSQLLIPPGFSPAPRRVVP